MDDNITDDNNNEDPLYEMSFDLPIKTTKPRKLVKPKHQPTLSEYMNNKSP